VQKQPRKTFAKQDHRKVLEFGGASFNVVGIMAMSVVEFSREGYKIRKSFG
jgi:hypothetical protein